MWNPVSYRVVSDKWFLRYVLNLNIKTRKTEKIEDLFPPLINLINNNQQPLIMSIEVASSLTPVDPPRGELEPIDEECPVCLEVPSAALAAENYGDGFKTLSSCGHKVCCTCVNNILRTAYSIGGLKCPLCREIDTTITRLVDNYRRDRAHQGIMTIPVHVYQRLLRQATARTMNRTRVISGSRAAIPQMVPVFCLRCEKPGCQSKNKTKRRCVNHPQTPCCRNCKVCSECA